MADSKISALTSYTPATDTDVLPIVDTGTTTTKKITWANVKATLKTYFDTLYAGVTSPTFGTSITGSYLTASEMLITDASKNIVSAPVATYPSLTELSYVKGLSSAIQTQLGTKAPTASPTFTGTVTLPVGLTGVLRADTGVVSVDSDVTDIVAAASDTAAGKVELATTAETTTGTDATRAVTPDGLHGMTSLAGAAWFLDEDNMASDSATKTASQQSIKAYADTMLPKAGGTMTGNITLGENTSIALDPAGSADGKYSGITIAGTLGETVAFGEFVYLKAADSQWYKTDADAQATSGNVLVGACVLAGDDNGATVILLQGTLRADAVFPALTVGGSVYLSDATAGRVLTSIPTGADNIIRAVGFALTADEMYVSVSPDHQVTVA